MTLYASNAQIKAALNITDTDRDSIVGMAGSAASELIDLYCGRTFGTVSATRYYSASDSGVLAVDDLAGTALTVLSSSSVDGTYDVAWTADTDYQLDPLNGRRNGITWPYTALRAVGSKSWPIGDGEASVKVTGVFGWPSVPSVVVQAAVLQASRIYMRNLSPLGVAGGNEFGAMRVTRSVDPDVAVLLTEFRDGVSAAGGVG